MRIDDLADDLAARNAAFVAALSTPELPLTAIPASKIFTRDFGGPAGTCCVVLDDHPEEIDEEGPTYRIVSLPVEVSVLVSGTTEAKLKMLVKLYTTAIERCFSENPDYFGLEGRTFYDGFEGKSDIKAAKVSLRFKYEEAV